MVSHTIEYIHYWSKFILFFMHLWLNEATLFDQKVQLQLKRSNITIFNPDNNMKCFLSTKLAN